MKRYFIKRFRNSNPVAVGLEAIFQTIAATYGISPNIVSTDCSTYIKMVHLNEPCIADKYGENLDDIPEDIQEQIIEILWALYHECGIEYLDVTPYNFIEKKCRVYVVDFGDAKERDEYMDDYLREMFDTWKLKWNDDFL